MGFGIKARVAPEGADNKPTPAAHSTEKLSADATINRVTEISRGEAPEMYAVLDTQMAILNKQHGTHYPIPVLTRDPNDIGAEYKIGSNSVKLDPGTVERFKADPQAFAAVMGHELTHCFRVHEQDYFEKLENATDILAFRREGEMEADRGGALLTSPQASMRSLEMDYKSFANSPGSMAVELYKKTKHIDFDVAQKEFMSMSDKEANSFISQVNSMAPQEKKSLAQEYLYDRIPWETAHQSELDHPAYNTRINMFKQMEREQQKSTHTNKSFGELLQKHDFCHSHGNLAGMGTLECNTQHIESSANQNSARWR